MSKAVSKALSALEIVGGIVAIALGHPEIGFSLLASGAASLIPTKHPAQAQGFSQASQGFRQLFQAEAPSQRMVYGSVRVSGDLYEIGTTGSNNEYYHFIVDLAGHPVSSIGNIIINGELVDGTGADPKWAPYLRINRHDGTQTTADSDLLAEVPEWTSSMVGLGISYLYIRAKWSGDLFPRGIQNVQADVLGKLVYDPRTATTAYSDNWALVVRDFLTDAMGCGIPDATIDDTYTIASANTSDESVPTTSGGTQARYTVNGVIDTATPVLTNLQELLTAGAGNLVPLVEGVMRIFAGAYSTPTSNTLSDADLRADPTYQPDIGSQDGFNMVNGQYAGEETNWKLENYPQVGDSTSVASVGQLPKQINFPFCTDHDRCQRIATLLMKKSLLGGNLTMPCRISALAPSTMDVIPVTLTAFNLNATPMRAIDFSIKNDLSIDWILEKDDSSIYTWLSTDGTPFTPTTIGANLATTTLYTDLTGVTVRGLQIEGQANGTTFTGKDCKFDWRNFTARNFQELGAEVFGAGTGTKFEDWFAAYEVSVLNASGTVVRVERVMTNSYVYTYEKNVEDNGTAQRTFTVQVRMLGNQGQRTDPAAITVSNPAPSLPSNLRMQGTFGGIVVSFNWPTDLDRTGVQAWISSTTGYTPDASTLVYDGPDSTFIIKALSDGTALTAAATYYVHIGVYDAFGTDGMTISSEFAVTTTQVVNSQISYGSIEAINLAASVGNFWALKVNSSNQIAGMSIMSSGSTGSTSIVTFLDDQLALADPADPTNTSRPFVVNAGGSAHFGGTVDAANIQAGTISAALTVDALSFFGGEIAIGTNFAVDTSGNMTAANASLSGSLNVTGAVYSGQTAYGTGTGYWLQGGATPQISMGISGGQYFKFDAVTGFDISANVKPVYSSGTLPYIKSSTVYAAPAVTATYAGSDTGQLYSAWAQAQEISVPGNGTLSFSISVHTDVSLSGSVSFPAGTVISEVQVQKNGVAYGSNFTRALAASDSIPNTFYDTFTGTIPVATGDTISIYIRGGADINGSTTGSYYTVSTYSDSLELLSSLYLLPVVSR